MVLLNLGREDALDTEGPRRLVSSISRFLVDDDPYDGDHRAMVICCE
jgi:hypothetical protein